MRKALAIVAGTWIPLKKGPSEEGRWCCPPRRLSDWESAYIMGERMFALEQILMKYSTLADLPTYYDTDHDC